MAKHSGVKESPKRFFRKVKTSISLSDEDGRKEAKKFLHENSVDGFLSGIEKKMKGILEEFGLPTENPLRLHIKRADEETMSYLRSQGLTKENNLGDPSWPEEIQEAIIILVKIGWIRDFISENRAKDAVYECLSLMSHVQEWNFRVFDHLLVLGSANKKAVSLGGATTAKLKKEEAALLAKRLVKDANLLLRDGVQKRYVVGILALKFEKSKTHVRSVLKANNVL